MTPTVGASLQILVPGHGSIPAPIPRFIASILEIASSGTSGGVCIVLPRAGELDVLLAVLAALRDLGNDYRKWSSSGLPPPLSPTGRVRVVPDGFVYTLGDEQFQHGRKGVWLYFTDAKHRKGGGKFFVWETEYWRLEPTERFRPVSQDASAWSKPSRTPLDELSGASTRGSFANLTNHHILISSRTRFADALPGIPLIPRGTDTMCPANLEGCFPWGAIQPDASLSIESPRSAYGDPLVATSRDFELVRKVTDAASALSKVVISTWLNGCLSNLDTVNRIVERHRFLLLVPANRRLDIEPLTEAGWLAWEPKPSDLLAESSETVLITGLPDVDACLSAAQREQGSNVEHESCRCEALEYSHDSLQHFSSLIAQQAEVDSAVSDVEGNAWKIFHETSAILVAPTGTEASQRIAGLELLVRSAQAIKHLIGPDALMVLEQFTTHVHGFLNEVVQRGLSPKADVLRKVLSRITGETPCQIITATRAGKATLEELVLLLDAKVSVVTVAEYSQGIAPDVLVVCSIFSRDAFRALLDPWPAKQILFTGYEHEVATYRNRVAARAKSRNRLQLGGDALARMFGFPASLSLSPAVQAPVPDVAVDQPPDNLSRPLRTIPRARPVVIRGAPDDTTKPARLCQFRGASWAAFTDGFAVPVLEQTDGERLGRPTTRPVEELRSGDRILLREAGDSDIIRSLAEETVGHAVYQRRLAQAHLWKRELRTLESTEQKIIRVLKEHGLKRDPMTIRSWLRGESTIGPRSQDDLSIIAEVVNADIASAPWRNCTDAIREVRGWHLSAGMKLTELIVSQCNLLDLDVDQTELPLQTSLGLIWLVQIQEFDTESEPWSSGSVNRLQWSNPNERARLLSRIFSDLLADLEV